MTRIPYDQFYKQFLEEFLSPLGTVERSREVPGEARQVDVYFSPDPQSQEDPQTLGLLGQIATTPCLLEPFSDQPTLTEVRHCLLKLFLVQAELQRQAKREETRLTEAELPQLWILAASASEQLTTSFAAVLRQEWTTGVYFLGTALKTAIVAINQLPFTPSTLWLRLLGRGKTQQQAIAEVLAFSKTDPRRLKALSVLSAWRFTLETSNEVSAETQELIMTLSPAFLAWQREIEQRGEQRGQRLVVETLLKARFGELDETLSSIVSALLALPVEDYAQILLQLPNLSRQELIDRFQ